MSKTGFKPKPSRTGSNRYAKYAMASAFLMRFYDCKVLTIAFLKRDSINNVQIKMVAWQSYLLWVRNLARPLSHSHLHTFSPIHILSHSHLYTFLLCPIYTHSLLYTFFVPLTYTYSLFLTYTHSVYLWILHIFIPITYTLFPSNLLIHIFHPSHLYTFSIPLTYTHFLLSQPYTLSIIHILFPPNLYIFSLSHIYTFCLPMYYTHFSSLSSMHKQSLTSLYTLSVFLTPSYALIFSLTHILNIKMNEIS